MSDQDRMSIAETRLARGEARFDRIEQKLDNLVDEVSHLRSDIRSGRTGLRVLLWAGSVVGGLVAFAAWFWIELKKIGGL